MPITVRRARTSETAAWFRVVTTTFLDHVDLEAAARTGESIWDYDRLWGAWDGDDIVGTLRTFATELTVPGGAHIPATAVSAVSVLPTHRRRGALRQLITAEHAAARARGESIAVLHASEAAIYGRFGYGHATTGGTWTLDALGTGWTGSPASGVEFAPLDEPTAGRLAAVFEQYRSRTVGEIQRPAFTFEQDVGLRPRAWPRPWAGWVLLHRGPGGEPDGYARYSATTTWDRHQPRAVLAVQDLVAATDAAYDNLWRFLAEVDLVSTVTFERGAVDERLPWLLTNPRAAQLSDIGDRIWVALLDPAAALAGRRYERDLDIVLEVIGPEPAGDRSRLRLEAGRDGASCRPTRRAPDLTVHADALGAAYLGGTPLQLAVLARGAEEHRPGSLARAAAAFATLVPPRNRTFF